MTRATPAPAGTAVPTGLEVRSGIEASVSEPRRAVLLADGDIAIGDIVNSRLTPPAAASGAAGRPGLPPPGPRRHWPGSTSARAFARRRPDPCAARRPARQTAAMATTAAHARRRRRPRRARSTRHHIGATTAPGPSGESCRADSVRPTRGWSTISRTLRTPPRPAPPPGSARAPWPRSPSTRPRAPSRRRRRRRPARTASGP
mgnify:CR=1 FL=1